MISIIFISLIAQLLSPVQTRTRFERFLFIPQNALTAAFKHDGEHIKLYPRFCVESRKKQVRVGILVDDRAWKRSALWFLDGSGKVVQKSNWIDSHGIVGRVGQIRSLDDQIYYAATGRTAFVWSKDSLRLVPNPWFADSSQSTLRYAKGPDGVFPLYHKDRSDTWLFDDKSLEAKLLDSSNKVVQSWSIGPPPTKMWYWADPLVGYFGNELILWDSDRIYSIRLGTKTWNSTDLYATFESGKFGEILSDAEYHGTSYFSSVGLFYVLILTEKGLFVFKATQREP